MSLTASAVRPAFRPCAAPRAPRLSTHAAPSLPLRVVASARALHRPQQRHCLRSGAVSMRLHVRCKAASGGQGQSLSPASGGFSSSEETVDMQALAMEYGQKFLGLGLLLAADRALKAVFAQAGWSFPAPLAGMFIIIAVLKALDVFAPDKLKAVEDFFTPALSWITRWLPLFYVPSLVMLPIVLKSVPSAAMAKVVGIVCVGMVASLFVTAQVAVAVRGLVKTEMAEAGPPSKGLPPPNRFHKLGWLAIFNACLLGAAVSPAHIPFLTAPFLLSGTVGGYLVGVSLPGSVQKILHPIVTTCLLGIASVGLWGLATGSGFESALLAYKGSGAGAGDILMNFLGIVILSFGFRVYSQRDLMARHKYEILGCTLASAVFSLFSTVLMCRAVGLDPLLSCAIAPRAVTVALALPIAQQLEAASLAGVTAAAVCFEGLVGASFCQPLLDKLGFKDPIVRGMSTAGAAHGLGTASLAAKEPDALPFCALAYAVIGILATLISCIPFVRYALMAIAGMPIAA